MGSAHTRPAGGQPLPGCHQKTSSNQTKRLSTAVIINKLTNTPPKGQALYIQKQPR